MAIYGTKNHDTINGADGVTDQKDIIFGLEGDDTISGLGGDDVMKGGGGADTFYGGAGSDWVDYGDSDKKIHVELSTNEAYGGTAQGDEFYSVENVGGSLHDDWIEGNSDDNTLRGSGGDDRLYGHGGLDVLEGGDGDDDLFGGTSVDKLYGGDDNDYLSGGAGADQLFGGEGDDTAYYRESPTAVTVLLEYELAFKGNAEGDTFSSIENITGSNYDDLLGGNDGVNRIHGTEGNDTVKGYGGADVLYGGFQDDTLIGGLGIDTLYGGGQTDKFVWASVDETGFTAATADIVADFVFADGDRIDLSGIDADVYALGNQAFTFIGTAAFTLNLSTPENTDVVPGEIRYYHAGGNTYIEMQTGQSADVEAVIRLDGILTPEASWFIL